MSNHDLQETVYKEAFIKDFDERTDAEKVVVWQQHTISGLKDQIKTLQEINLINVDQGIHVRRFSGECDDLTLDFQMPLVESYEILDSTVIDSYKLVQNMIELAEVSETVDEYLHYQMVVNFSYVNT
jgi:hypothetical protein